MKKKTILRMACCALLVSASTNFFVPSPENKVSATTTVYLDRNARNNRTKENEQKKISAENQQKTASAQSKPAAPKPNYRTATGQKNKNPANNRQKQVPAQTQPTINNPDSPAKNDDTTKPAAKPVAESAQQLPTSAESEAKKFPASMNAGANVANPDNKPIVENQSQAQVALPQTPLMTKFLDKDTVSVIGEYLIEQKETINDARNGAMNDALRSASEMFGVYLSSTSKTELGSLTKDDIEVISRHYLKVIEKRYEEIANPEGHTLVRVHAIISIDVNAAEQKINELKQKDDLPPQLMVETMKTPLKNAAKAKRVKELLDGIKVNHDKVMNTTSYIPKGMKLSGWQLKMRYMDIYPTILVENATGNVKL